MGAEGNRPDGEHVSHTNDRWHVKRGCSTRNTNAHWYPTLLCVLPGSRRVPGVVQWRLTVALGRDCLVRRSGSAVQPEKGGSDRTGTLVFKPFFEKRAGIVC